MGQNYEQPMGHTMIVMNKGYGSVAEDEHLGTGKPGEPSPQTKEDKS